MTDLTNYGTVTTKDMLARRVYNNEAANINSVGIIIESVSKCLDVSAGTTIALTALDNIDIVAGAGLDVTVTGAIDIQGSEIVTLESDGSALNLTASTGLIQMTSATTTTVTSGGNMSTGVTGTSNLDATGAITIDSSGSTIGIGNDAVNQNITIGTGGSRPLIQVGNSIITTASLQANAIAGDFNFGSGGFILDTADGGAVSIDAIGAPSNFSLASTADADDLTISVTGANDASLILSSTGTNAANAIEITASVGGLDMNVAGNKTEDVTLNSTNTIGGNKTETITGNSTITCNGATGFTLDCDKIINLDSNDATAGAVKIAASNAAGGIDIDCGTGGINTNTTGATVSTTTGTTTTTMTGAESITNTAGSERTVGGQYSVDCSQSAANAIKINASATAGGIDVDAGTGGINTNTTGTSTNTATTGYSIATSGVTSNVSISALGGGAQEISLTSAGTGVGAITIDATAGGLDVDVATSIDIQAGTGDINMDTTSGNIKIGTDITTTDIYLGNTTTANSSTTYLNKCDAAGELHVTGDSFLKLNCTISGNLTVQGDTVTMNTATVVSEDKNIELNNGTSATMTDVGALGGGITLNGDTNKTFIWSSVNTNSTNDSWDLSEDCNIADLKYFTINKKRALTQTQCYINTKAGLAAADFDDSAPAFYLNQATPMTDADNDWRIRIDAAGDVVFQKRVGGTYQNKFRIQ